MELRKMTGGGLTKRQLKYNINGKIVSRKVSNAITKRNKKKKKVQRGGVNNNFDFFNNFNNESNAPMSQEEKKG